MSATTPDDLTRFQFDLLVVLYGRPRHGQGAQSELEAWYDVEINHGRLYRNLDELERMGLIEKTRNGVSDRSHLYELTSEGHGFVYEYVSEASVRLNIF